MTDVTAGTTMSDDYGNGKGGRYGRRGERVGAGEAGFGLVETLFALVILAVALLAIGGIALHVGRQAWAATETTDKALAAQQVMELTVSRGYAGIPTGTKDTTVTVDGRNYTVTRAVTEVVVGLKEVQVEPKNDASETLVTRVSSR